MKPEKLLSALWAFCLSFALSLSSAMCVCTAFDLALDTGLLLCTCGAAAVVCSVCYCLPLGLVPLGIGAGCLGYLWQIGSLEASAEAFLNRLSRQYHNAYCWGIIRWSHRTTDGMAPDIVFMLCILGAAVAMLTAWAICRRKTVFPALSLSFALLATCFVVTDTVPDTPWLYLLLLCFILLIMTGSVRKQDPVQANRLCLWLTPAVALALLLLFAALPREQYAGQAAAKRLADAFLQSDSIQQLFGRIDQQIAATGTVDTDAVDLTRVGYRTQTHTQALQVTAPYTGTLYLRGRAMDTYDGISWSNSNNYSSLNWPNHQLENMGELTVSTRFAHRMLYMPYYTGITEMRDVTTGIENEKLLTEYSFTCRILKETDYLSKLYSKDSSKDTLGPQLQAQYIPMDEQVRTWAQPLVSRICSVHTNSYQKAQAIAAYVRNSAVYNTRTARMPASHHDFAQWFLKNSDTGYCVHFATAATVLLQAAGIPARYVTGYMTQVTQGEQITVYSDQAHAWVEYWLPGFGWTVLEVTPGDTAPVQTQSTVSAATEAGRFPEQTESALPDSAPTQPPVPAPRPTARKTATVLTILGVLLLLIVAGELQRRLRRYLRQRKLAAATVNEKALIYWQESVAYARLLRTAPNAALYALAEKAKYSQYTLTEEDLAPFTAFADTAIGQLKRRNIFLRLIFRFFLAIY